MEEAEEPSAAEPEGVPADEIAPDLPREDIAQLCEICEFVEEVKEGASAAEPQAFPAEEVCEFCEIAEEAKKQKNHQQQNEKPFQQKGLFEILQKRSCRT
jgi:hypothetical protein